MNLLFLLREYMFSGDVNKLNLSCQSLYSCSLVNTWYDEWSSNLLVCAGYNYSQGLSFTLQSSKSLTDLLTSSAQCSNKPGIRNH